MIRSSVSSDWRALRAEFPATHLVTCLDTRTSPPLSRRAADEAQRYYAELLGDPGRLRDGGQPQIERVRALVAGLLNALPEEIAFTGSVSQGLALAASALGPPAHVVAMMDDAPALARPFVACGHCITTVEAGAGGAITVDHVARAIAADTRAVLTSTILPETGFRQDLGALGDLCRSRRVSLIVDASPTLGAMPIDVRAEAIDLIVCAVPGGGAGVLYAGDAFGASRATAASSEGESAHGAGILALGGALDLLVEVGLDQTGTRIHDLTGYLHRRLEEHAHGVVSPRDRSRLGGLTIVRKHDPPEAVAALASAGIIVSARARGIGVALHVLNVEEDIDRFVAALDALRRGERPERSQNAQGPLVCVDLNGVLDSYQGWQGADHWDPPLPGAREFLRELHDSGCRVVVFTTRHYHGVWQWLRDHALAEFVADVTDRKPPADVFVDDRAVCFHGDYTAALQQIREFAPHWERGRPSTPNY